MSYREDKVEKTVTTTHGTIYVQRAKRTDSEIVSAEVGGVRSEGIR